MVCFLVSSSQLGLHRFVTRIHGLWTATVDVGSCLFLFVIELLLRGIFHAARINVLRLESGTRTLLSWTTCCKRLVGSCDESRWDLYQCRYGCWLFPALPGSWQSSPISGSWCFIATVGCLRTPKILRGPRGLLGSNLLKLGIHSRNALAKFGLRDELLCRSLLPPLLRRITEKSKWEETSGKHPLGEALGSKMTWGIFEMTSFQRFPFKGEMDSMENYWPKYWRMLMEEILHHHGCMKLQ